MIGQAIVAIPGLETLQKYGDAAEALMRRVAGVPLLVRIIATASQANVDSILLVWPEDINPAILTSSPEFKLLKDVKLDHLVWPTAFDPRSSTQWAALADQVDDEFLWLPWNWITHRQALQELSASCVRPVTWQFPVLLEKFAILERARFRVSSGRQTQGLRITSLTCIPAAERFLVEHAANAADEINGQFNRRLCAPLVRLLTHTGVKPGAISFAGLVLAILAALTFARGSYLNYVAAAVLFFVSALCAEMRVMLSRLRFRESDSGTWFEGLTSNIAYLAVFAGIVVGLHREYGAWALKYGTALMIGCILSILVIGVQRKLATTRKGLQSYTGWMNQLMEADPSKGLARIAKRIHIFVKKGVLAQCLLLFSFFGAMPLFLYLAAVGANLTWILALYFTRRFVPTPPLQPVVQDLRTAA